MALTFTFIGATPNRAVYKITSTSGGQGVLTNEGAVTPDLSTDIKAGTPLGDYLRRTVATGAAAENLLQYTTAAEVRVQCSTATTDALTAYFAVQAVRNSTSGLAQLQINADADGTVGDCGGVLSIELYHTIAK